MARCALRRRKTRTLEVNPGCYACARKGPGHRSGAANAGRNVNSRAKRPLKIAPP